MYAQTHTHPPTHIYLCIYKTTWLLKCCSLQCLRAVILIDWLPAAVCIPSAAAVAAAAVEAAALVMICLGAVQVQP